MPSPAASARTATGWRCSPRGEASLRGAAREVEAAGGVALAVPTDVSDPEAVEAAAARVEEELGPIDVWVNDAMTTVFAFFEEIEPEEYRRATDVTYHGMVWGTRSALRRMRPRDAGTIVQVGSAMAYQGIPLQAPYCGAKHAVKGFFDSIRTELRHKGSKVHVTMVQLPGVNTPQFDHCRSKMPKHPQPVPPVYQPEVAAEAVHWAARTAPPPGLCGRADLLHGPGSKLAPWLAELYLAKTAVEGQLAEADPPTSRTARATSSAGRHRPRRPWPLRRHSPRRSPQWFLSRHRNAMRAPSSPRLPGSAPPR